MDASSSTSRSFSATATGSGFSGGQSWKENRPYYVCKYCHQIFEYFNHFLRHVKNHPAFQDGTKSLSMAIIQSTVHPFQEHEEDLTEKEMDREEDEEEKAAPGISTPFPILAGLLGAHFLEGADTDDDKTITEEKNLPSSLASCRRNGKSLHNGDGVASESKRKQLYRCSTCSKTFKLKHMLDTHLLIHTGEKPYACEYCPKTFRLRISWREHTRVHTGEKPYPCKYCSKTFRIYQTYASHIKLHTGEKPHSCKLCPKSFRVRQRLVDHIRTHTGEKPLQCPQCSKRFTSHSNLYKHKKIHSNSNQM